MAAGADFIQFDEPVLTELVFTQGQTRTFMCAALAARNDPAEELEFAVGLINRVLDGVDGRTHRPACLPRQLEPERVDPAARAATSRSSPTSSGMQVQQLVLEYATPRAGDLLPFAGKELGLGVVNPRTPTSSRRRRSAARSSARCASIPPSGCS